MEKPNLRPVLIFDIETTQTSDPVIIELIREKLKPPATLKKQESIQEWWATQSGQALQDKLAQTALNGLYGDVTAIGWNIALNPEKGDLDYKLAYKQPSVSVRGNDQSVQGFLTETYRKIEAEIKKFGGPFGPWDVRVAGHNIIGFDLPFLKQQSIRYSVRHMSYLMGGRDQVIYTMTALAGYREFISLKEAAIVLGGIPWDNSSIPGDQVPSAWESGDHESVSTHLANDVNATAEIVLRVLSFDGSRWGASSD